MKEPLRFGQHMGKEFVSELIGTFFLVLIGCGAVKLGYSGPRVAVAFGGAVFIIILLSRKYSGAHINPAVSIAFTISGELEKSLLWKYICAQLIGALLAGIIIGNFGATNFAVSISWGIIIEIFITFVLMMSIYLTIWQTDNDLIVAIVVGIIVALLAFYFGEYTGASMNPARTFGPNIASNNMSNIPVYWAATSLGAIMAAVIANLRRNRMFDRH